MISAFGPKQTCRKTQSMLQLGVERTCLLALQMSDSATCGFARCHLLTSPFQTLIHPQSLYIHPSVQFADVHGGMFFESHCDAIFDVLLARQPPYLFALRLCFAGNGRPFVSNL